ncbi:tyrosine-type recombinase/integrase [Roseivivax sp. CAU 1761]
MSPTAFSARVPDVAIPAIGTCRFADSEIVAGLGFRDSPYWHALLRCRHLGIHRPDHRICNWTARLLTRDKRYVQKCLGPALELGRGRVGFHDAVERAFEWFEDAEKREIANAPKATGRVTEISVCPTGEVYTVGHALRDYVGWTRLARSPGGHYNNLVLINYHLVPNFAAVPLEQFNATHSVVLAQQVLETPPRFGFMPYRTSVSIDELTPDELRRRKRTYNSLASILRMAFQHAWESGHISSERPWRCLKRIPVSHAPRTIFLTRPECTRLLDACTPALRRLVLAALYSGCRVGELGALRVEDVGRQGFGLRVGSFKRGPERFVFLPDEGMVFFLACCEGKSDRDPVLLSDREKVWRRQHTNLFRRAIAKAGLPTSFVFHGLRHTYASDLVRAGVPLDIVAKQLGHANTITVSNTYGHLAEHYREEQVRKRFTPLSDEHARQALAAEARLHELWESFQPADWRDYGAVDSRGRTPLQAFTRVNHDVLEIFSEAERSRQCENDTR